VGKFKKQKWTTKLRKILSRKKKTAWNGTKRIGKIIWYATQKNTSAID
jgi:hypothetical protein